MSIGELMFYGGLAGVVFSFILLIIIKILLSLKEKKLRITLKNEYSL